MTKNGFQGIDEGKRMRGSSYIAIMVEDKEVLMIHLVVVVIIIGCKDVIVLQEMSHFFGGDGSRVNPSKCHNDHFQKRQGLLTKELWPLIYEHKGLTSLHIGALMADEATALPPGRQRSLKETPNP
eukprot:TRINITY_DN1755_c0_g1_i1.p1 TRINITY_DN1755_c0_g1~~TRINITY_DN1755_c0_g1_i1.p1  ORF type:complete len:126 (-),score=14.96 TRINITY_DN1755_c0_g1_i1:89-466(-)